MPNIARSQETRIEFWTSQGGSTQKTAYENIMKRFEQKYPQYKVNVQYFAGSTTQFFQKLTSGLAVGDAPDLVSHMPAPPVVELAQQGLLEPFDDVINAVGKDDFYANTLDIYRDQKTGKYIAATIVNNSTTNLWYRTDLLAQAQLQPPKNWSELLAVAKALTKGPVYGTCLPMGKQDMGTLMTLQYIWGAGGTVFNPDLSVNFNSPQTVAALEFAKQLFAYSPSGSASYGYGEAVNTFVQGRVASTPYTGRVVQNIKEQNPSLTGKYAVMSYPAKDGATPTATCVADFYNLFLPKGGKNLAGAKLLAQWLYKKEEYIEFLFATGVHALPVLKSVATSKEYAENPIVVNNRGDVDIMLNNLTKGRNLLQETDAHKYNVNAGRLYGTHALVEIFQDVLIGGVDPKTAAAKGADKIATIMRA